MIFRNGKVILEGEDPSTAYAYLRFMILGNQLPVIKVIGFKITSMSDASTTMAVDRHQALVENMIKISNNLAKVIFLPNPNMSAFVAIPEYANMEVTTGSAEFVSSGHPVIPLDKNLYLYYPMENIGIRLIVDAGVGRRTMESNVERMKELYNVDNKASEFFPLDTEHTLIDYVRILPWQEGQDIRYKLLKGITDSDLNSIWKEGTKCKIV